MKPLPHPNRACQTLRQLLPALLLALLSGCAGMGDFAARVLPRGADQLVASQSLEGTASGEIAPAWWQRFGDPQLDALIDEALKGSPSLQIAAARLGRAEAAAGVAQAAGKAASGLNFSADRELLTENYIYPPPLGGSYQSPARLSANFSYELDFWGRNKSRLAGALSELEASRAEAAAVRLMLVSAISHSYVALDRQFAQQELVERLLTQRQEALRLVDLRVAAGLEAKSAHDKAAAQVAAAMGLRASSAEQVLTLRHQLAALLGAGPDRGLSIQRPALTAAGELALPSRLPADLIGRRPDVAALRARVEAAGQYTEAAKADFYPDVNLVAFVGLQALSIGDLLKAGSKEMGIGPAVHLPLFDGGRLRQRLAGRYAEQDGAVAEYNQGLADALREIADVVSRWRSLDQRQAEQRSATANLVSAREHARRRYVSGLNDRLGLIGAEIELINEEARDINLRAERFAVAIDLARAVGGGAPAYAAPAPAPALSLSAAPIQ